MKITRFPRLGLAYFADSIIARKLWADTAAFRANIAMTSRAIHKSRIVTPNWHPLLNFPSQTKGPISRVWRKRQVIVDNPSAIVGTARSITDRASSLATSAPEILVVPATKMFGVCKRVSAGRL